MLLVLPAARTTGCRLWRYLDGHDGVAASMDHLVDGAERTATDLSQVVEILAGEVVHLVGGDLQLAGRLDALASLEPLPVA